MSYMLPQFVPSKHSYSYGALTNPKTLRYQGGGGYVYGYTPATGAITILATPEGPTNQTVSKGSSAYEAILKEIQTSATRLSDSDSGTGIGEKLSALRESEWFLPGVITLAAMGVGAFIVWKA